ncbi:MAG: SDR family oxidoreductase [Candidatus Aenigmatarchaeota archaeon]
MRVLIIGAEGFLGQKLFSIFSKSHETFGTSKDGKNFYRLDLTDKKRLYYIANETSPEVIINAAGITDVDYCEENPELVKSISGICIDNLLLTCAKHKCKLVHFSTDYIFDGKKGDYIESDEAYPVNVYGEMKLEQEKEIISSDANYIIPRVAVLYGYNSAKDKKTFVNWVIERLRQGESISVADDQFVTPTIIDDVANALKRLLEIGERGIFHVAGSECISRHALAVKVAEVFNLDKSLITPASSRKLMWKARRPMNSCLRTDKLNKLNIKMSNMNEGLSEMKRQMS